MHVFISLAILVLVLGSVGGAANYIFYADNVYKINQTAELLHNAQSTTDLGEKSAHMSKDLWMGRPVRGNESVWTAICHDYGNRMRATRTGGISLKLGQVNPSLSVAGGSKTGSSMPSSTNPALKQALKMVLMGR